MSAISSISSNYLQTAFSSAIQKQGIGDPLSGLLSTKSTSSTQKTDSGHLSPFAQIVTKLQDLQKSDPAKYQQVTAQIAANLQSAAQTAQANGNTAAATQLNTIASNISDASKSGQLPNFGDIAQAVSGGHRGHHHRAHAAVSKPADSDGDNDGTKPAAPQSSSSQSLSQLFASFQPSSTGTNSSFDPAAIIFSTLNSAGIGSSK